MGSVATMPADDASQETGPAFPYAALSNMPATKTACALMSRPSILRTCPFLIIAIASKPANVLRAVGNPLEAEPRPNQALDAPVILLHDVVQVFALPQTGPAPEFAIPLHLRDRPGVGRVLVDRQGARTDGVRSGERLAEEPLRRGRIPPRRQQEIDRLPPTVHRPIQIRPASFHPNVGLVHPPGAVAHPQMRADSFLKLSRIGLDPAEDRRVVDFDPAIQEHQLEVAVADRKHQIPSYGPQDHVCGELPSLEEIAPTHRDVTPHATREPREPLYRS